MLNKKVENPSEHLKADDEVKATVQQSKLAAYEQTVVDTYKQYVEQFGLDAAEEYLYSKSAYLPRGFHPNNF